MTTHSTVIGVFENRDNALHAVDDLRRAGFREDQIGIVSRDARGIGPQMHDETTHSYWEEGAGFGAAAGAVTGTGLGLAVAAGLIPGIGPIIAGGTLAALLASAGTGAAVGTVVGSLIGLGIPEEEAKLYETEFAAGRTVVTIHADGRAADVWDILGKNGAYSHEPVGADTGPTFTPY